MDYKMYRFAFCFFSVCRCILRIIHATEQRGLCSAMCSLVLTDNGLTSNVLFMRLSRVSISTGFPYKAF